MPVRLRVLPIVLMGLLIAPMSANALVPVIDFASIQRLIAQYDQLMRQYHVIKKTYHNAQQRLKQAKRIASDAEGHYGYGNLLNSSADLTQREWSPNNWQDALKGVAGGNPARYQQLVAQYKHNHPSLSASDYQQDNSQAKTKNYEQQVQTNQAVGVQATYAFNQIKTQLQHVHQLSTKIDQANNTKAALDLNSRLLTALGYISIQELKMQTLMTQQLAQDGANSVAAHTQSATFNQLPSH